MLMKGQTLEDIPLNRFHKRLTVRSGGGSFVDGYVLSIIGVVMVQMADALHVDSLWQGLIAASALIGIFFGGMVGGWLTDHFGRKRVFVVGPVLFMGFSIVQLVITAGWQLFACRFMLGVAVGIEYPVATALLVEFLPKSARGPRLATLTILWFAGAACAYIMGNAILQFGGPEAWRLALASTAIFGLILFVLRLGTPESPRWLISKGRREAADRIIKQVFGPQYSIADLAAEPERSNISLWGLLKAGYGSRLAFVSLFWTCSVIPVFAVYAFAPKVLLALNLHGEMAAFGSIAITLLFVVGCILATGLINGMGRRPMVIHSFLWSGLALLGLGYSADASPLMILILFGSYALLIGGAQVLQLVYPNEIFPTEIRAVAVGFGTSFSRIGAAAGTWLVPISLDRYGIGITMYIAAGVTLVGLIVSLALAPETRALNLAEASALPNRS